MNFKNPDLHTAPSLEKECTKAGYFAADLYKNDAKIAQIIQTVPYT